MYSQLKERDIETLIDTELRYLGWLENPKDMSKCNVYKQRAKTSLQEKQLNGKRPDYVLYENGKNEPLAIIEAKKPHEDIKKAIKQAIGYAKMIGAPIIFATDGIYTKTYHVKTQKPLYLNGEVVDELLKENILVNFIKTNTHNSQTKKVAKSREELIGIFSSINNDFRDAGVSSGLPRTHLFCNMLFLKVISELSEMGDKIVNLPPKEYLWNSFKNKKGIDLLDFLNKQAFDYFKHSYGGEVLSKINIMTGKEEILDIIISKLDDLWLSDSNVDVTGEAFEFFLRTYGGAETDFGEYFTPRHIIRTMTKLLNPQFGEKVYDPFCGTGGMLIEAFKHIKRRMPLNKRTISDLKQKTVFGGELSTMSRIAKMNMILAGDGHSNIVRQDSYENKQTNKFDVVMTNIPFGNKMKTTYLSNYGYNGNSAEVCGVLHCLDSLSDSENARAGILVPEGILFNGNKAYTSLRHDLIEKHSVEKIVSLPRGIFPDANVKSNLLIVKKKPNKNKKSVWYFNLKNDGYTIDKKRTPIKGNNDIDILISEKNILEKDIKRLSKLGFSLLDKNELRKESYILLSNQYTKQNLKHKKFPILSLKEIEKKGMILFLKGQGISKKDIGNNNKFKCITYGELYTEYNSPIIDKVKSSTDVKTKIISISGDVLIPGTTTADAMGIAIARSLNKSDVQIGGDINIIRTKNKDIIADYLALILSFPLKTELAKYARGANILHLSNKNIKKIQIVLPPIKEQKKIVSTFYEKQKIIEKQKNKLIELNKELNLKLNNIFEDL